MPDPILLPPSSPRLPAPLPFQIAATASLLLPRPGSLLRLDGPVHRHDRNEPNPIAESRNIAMAPCSAAAEAARDLRDAVAALAVRRAADEDALRRRAVALDADVRRLQGSLAPLDPAMLDEPSLWPAPEAAPCPQGVPSPRSRCLARARVPRDAGSACVRHRNLLRDPAEFAAV
ncbi:uncharacterized protein [Aegilops tauschii subsp. strangulata]|uniref:uncharacterized protein isoform X2 n=1 Tax=Aegilops tauschii subsp. strangulata TaxID=200361 RepID=UPI001ABC2591